MQPVNRLSRATDEVIAFFASAPSQEQIAQFRLSDETRRRVRDLLAKNSAGVLTEAESEELDECVQLDQIIMLIRTRARRAQGSHKTA